MIIKNTTQNKKERGGERVDSSLLNFVKRTIVPYHIHFSFSISL